MSHYNITTIQDFFKDMYGDTTEHNVEIRICDNVRGRSPAKTVFTRKPTIIETHVSKNASENNSVYFGVATRRKGDSKGAKANCVELPALWVDIDCDKDNVPREDVANAFKQSKYPPTYMIESGGGLHAYWLLNESINIEDKDEQKKVEATLKVLCDLYAGDGSVCEVARIMRLPGTLNTKEATIERYGKPVACDIIVNTHSRYELEDISEWVNEQQPFIQRQSDPKKEQQVLSDPFSILGNEFKASAPMDVDQALKVMRQGKEGATIHETQLKVTGSLVRRGIDDEKILQRVLEATVKAAGREGTKWDWEAEEISIREMIASANEKLDKGEWERHVPKILQKPKEGDIVSDDWHKDLIKGGKEGDTILPKLVNAVLLLENKEGFENAIAYNEMSCRTLLLKPIPSHPIETNLPREWSDVDDVILQAWFESNYMMIPKSTVTDAVAMVSKKNRYNPLKDRLNGLEWDGVERIDSWMTDFLDVKEDIFTKGVGRKFLISAVARALRPGCKVDTILVLEGDQGRGKSTACSILCMDKEWFGDNMPDVSSGKPAYEYLQGKWIIEVAELNAMNKAESIKTKSFLSSPTDRYRASYGRYSQDYHRGCVFIATCNPEGGYLEDATGSRRFWPVTVGNIDVAGLQAITEQLWAEAVAAFKSDEGWWLNANTDIDKAAKEAQDARHFDDLWLPYVKAYVTNIPTNADNGSVKSIKEWDMRAKSLEYIDLTYLIVDAIGKPLHQVSKIDRNRVGKILTYMGWKNTSRRVGDKHIKELKKVWVPPVVQKELFEDKEDFEESVF